MKIDTEGEIAMAQALGHPTANPEQVRYVVEELRKAYEFAVNTAEKPVGFIDGFMALSNFVRLVVEDLEMRSKFSTTEEKYIFRRLLVDTITRSPTLAELTAERDALKKEQIKWEAENFDLKYKGVTATVMENNRNLREEVKRAEARIKDFESDEEYFKVLGRAEKAESERDGLHKIFEQTLIAIINDVTPVYSHAEELAFNRATDVLAKLSKAGS